MIALPQAFISARVITGAGIHSLTPTLPTTLCHTDTSLEMTELFYAVLLNY